MAIETGFRDPSGAGHSPRSVPEVSYVLPAYNEEELLARTVERLVAEARSSRPGRAFEILLVENGSTDGTPGLVRRLASEVPEVRGWSLAEPSYGEALRSGILSARGPVTVVFNVDFWSLDFAGRALDLLRRHHLVVGSKCAPGARDERGWKRRLVTGAFNGFLRVVFGFRGTDTHGMKAFRTAEFRPLAAECVTDREIFDTELVLRAQMAGLRLTELPVDVRELRPTRYGLLSRVPSVMREVRSLWRSIGRSAAGRGGARKAGG